MNNLPKYTPDAGGTIYIRLKECLSWLQEQSFNVCTITMNDVTITVYRTSSIADLCDKFDMQRKITYKQY